MIVRLNIPPGTVFEDRLVTLAGSGQPPRWARVNNMRWYNGRLQVFGGQHTFAASQTAATTPVRAIHTWRDNSNNRYIALGSPTKLEVTGDGMTYPNDIVNITPSGFTTGNEDGSGDTMADTWTLDSWGEYLVGCSTSDGKLYEWQLDYGTPTLAAAISGAPTGCVGLVVTPERFVFALGAGGDKRVVQWCDQSDNTDWTPVATNQAGSFTLETDGRIMGACVGRGETLIFTDAGDVWAARYIGPPYIYGFERVGSGAPMCSPNSAVFADDKVWWMGRGGFYVYDGRVRQLFCPVQRGVFDVNSPNTLDEVQRYKVWGTAMRKYNEVWWVFPPDALESAYRYVAYNYRDGLWMIGDTNATTVFADRGVYDYPVSMNAGTRYYLDQVPGGSYTWWVGTPSALTTAFAPLRDDGRWFHANWYYPDHFTDNNVDVVVSGYEASADVHQFQTIDSADFTPGGGLGVQRVPIRLGGRFFTLEVRPQDNTLAFGAPAIDFVPMGRR